MCVCANLISLFKNVFFWTWKSPVRLVDVRGLPPFRNLCDPMGWLVARPPESRVTMVSELLMLGHHASALEGRWRWGTASGSGASGASRWARAPKCGAAAGEANCTARPLPVAGGRGCWPYYWQSGGISSTPYRVPLYVYELRGLLGVTIARKTNKSAGMCPTSVGGQYVPPSAQHCQSLRSAAM